MRKTLLTVVLLFLLAGCEIPTNQKMRDREQRRVELFTACMELAAKMPRQSDDDVARIVDSCATQASLMSVHYLPKGEQR